VADLSTPLPVQLRNWSAFRAPENGERDLSLPYLHRADFEEMNALIPGGLPMPSNKQSARAIASMSSALVTQAQIDPDVYFSCSRGRTWWANAGRYVGTSYTYASACWAMEVLAEADIICDLQIAPRRAPRFKDDGTLEQAFQSRFRPSDRLRGLALPKVRVEKGETIILKDRAGRLMPYKDTERTHRMRRFVEAFNEACSGWDIDLPAPGSVEEGYLLRFLPDGEGSAEFVVNTTLRSMFRVFNHGAWTKGGRYYGGWWQQVRSRDRAFFRLNGSEVEELDIDHCHPDLLYGKAGLRLDGDAYEMDGWTRAQGKQAFNTLLNSSTEAEALHSIAWNLFGGETDPAAMIIRHVRRRHPKIDALGLFCSGAGLELMNADAEVAHDVMRDLAIKAKVPVLPVHDSFIVRKQDVGLLAEAIERALAKQGIRSPRVSGSSDGSMACRDIVLHTQEGSEGEGLAGETGWVGSESGVCVRAPEGLVSPLVPGAVWDEGSWASVFDEAGTDRMGNGYCIAEAHSPAGFPGGKRTATGTRIGQDTAHPVPVDLGTPKSAGTGIRHRAPSPVLFDPMATIRVTGIPLEALSMAPPPSHGNGPQGTENGRDGSTSIPVTGTAPAATDAATMNTPRKTYRAPPSFVWGHDGHDSAAADRAWAHREAAAPLSPSGRRRRTKA
jgi:hypothetical protein